jgi:negative regulator of sigma-B (phosphoserine phosphatase)
MDSEKLDEISTAFSPLISFGVAALTLRGETESGDEYLVKPNGKEVLVAALDGLGHGPEAALAARRGRALLEAHAEEPLLSLVGRCHQGLARTRGVAMSLASIHARDNSMTWLGVGNVEGVLLAGGNSTGSGHEWLMLRGGVVGYQLPPLRASLLPIKPGDLLIFCTDGIASGFLAGLEVSDPPQRIADQILARYAKRTDDALVLVARYLGTGP